jgi:gliding motility-associated-like protein
MKIYKKRVFEIVLFLMLCSAFPSFSQKNGAHLSFGFIQNKGQVIDQNNKKNERVKYLFPTGKGMNVQLKQDGFSYDFYRLNKSSGKTEKNVSGKRQVIIPNDQISLSRIDVIFLNCNPDAELESGGLIETSLQFKNYKEVKQFQKITYKDIYPNIDAVFYADVITQQVKYDFIVRSGGDVSQIQLQFKGFDACIFDRDRIQMEHSLGTLNEVIPKSWCAESKELVKVNYKKLKQSKGDLVVGFELPAIFDKSKTLVIDPEPILNWGTYLGDSLETISTGVVTDKNGNVYTCGTTQSVLSLATVGAYQSQINDSLSDAFLMKFNQYGFCQWATYFGGNTIDLGMDVQVDTLNNVYLYGTTFSDTNIASLDAFQDTLLGVSDVFLAKFTKQGELLWSTYYGGAGEESASKLSLDFKGNVYITGTTQNSPSELATIGVHQITNNGAKDAFVTKIDTAGQIVWSTYFGGVLDEESTGISFGDTCVFISGYTNSVDLISTDSTHQDSLKGGVDGYVSKFDAGNGTQIWGTYFGGTANDYVNSVRAYNQVVYIVGTTLSDDGIDMDTINSSTRTVRNGEEDAFLCRVSSADGKIFWSNYYGGAQADYGVELDVEMGHDVFLLGTTLSDSAIATTEVHQDSIGGLKDVFIAKFSEYGEHRWGTYYGGPMDEVAYSIDVYGNTNVYVAGSTQSDTAIARVNSTMYQWKDTISGLENGFLAQFKQNISTMPGGFGGGNSPGNLIYCLGDTVQIFIEGGALGSDAEWGWYANQCGEDGVLLGFGDTVTFVATESFDIFVRAETVTNASDCLSAGVTVVAKPVAQITSMSHMCMENEYLFTSSAVEGDQVIWSGPNSFTSLVLEPTLVVTDAFYSGTYNLKITDLNGCWDTTSIDLSVFNQPVLTFTSSDLTCYGSGDGSISLSAVGDAPFEYTFSGVASLDTVYQDLYCDTFYFSVKDVFGCIANDSVYLSQPQKIIANVVVDSSICVPGEGVATVVVDSAYVTYSSLWLPSGVELQSVQDLGQGEIEVFVTLPDGCKDSSLVVIPPQYVLESNFTSVKRETCRGLHDGQATIVPVNGSAPYSYEWSLDGDSSDVHLDLAPGSYFVSVVDFNGCSSFDSVWIEQGDTLIWSEVIMQSDCGLNTGSIDLTIQEGNNPFVFNWSDLSTNEDLLNAGDSLYSVQILDSNGCSYTRAYELVYLDNLLVTATSNVPVIDLGAQVLLYSTSNLPQNEVSASWSPSVYLFCDTCFNTVGNPTDSISYVVVYTHESGCFGSDTVVVLVKRPCGEVFIPTVFSPNNDGLNDGWCVLGGCIELFHLTVYNQWGELVFISSNRGDCWDGTYKGELVQRDTYVYHLNYTLVGGQQVSESGSVIVNY